MTSGIFFNLNQISQKSKFDFFVFLKIQKGWVFVWIVLMSRIPQPTSCGMWETFYLIFHFSNVHPANVECGIVFIYVYFSQPASCTPQLAECRLWGYHFFAFWFVYFYILHPTFCKMRNAECGAVWIILWHFSIPHSTSRNLWNASCKTINKLVILFLSRIPQNWSWPFFFILLSSDGLHYFLGIINMIVLIYNFSLFLLL